MLHGMSNKNIHLYLQKKYSNDWTPDTLKHNTVMVRTLDTNKNQYSNDPTLEYWKLQIFLHSDASE